MLLVEGNYCPDVQLNCKRYLDSPGRYEKFRCSEYGPSTCLSKQRKPMKFCIDPHEYVPDGSPLPENFKRDRKSTRLNSSHSQISYAVFCLKKKKKKKQNRKKQTNNT